MKEGEDRGQRSEVRAGKTAKSRRMREEGGGGLFSGRWSTAPDNPGKRAQGAVHGVGARECAGDVGIENYYVGSLCIAPRVLAANATGKIVLRLDVGLSLVS